MSHHAKTEKHYMKQTKKTRIQGPYDFFFPEKNEDFLTQ